MATWEQRRRGIMATALEMERDLFAAENRYITELRTGMVDMQIEMTARLNQIIAQPRTDGQWDWERSQVESTIAELNRQIDAWAPKAVSTVQSGTSAADEMGAQYPLDILSAGGSDLPRSQPRLSGTSLAMFHSYDAGLVRGVSERTRAEITGLIRRSALGGDSVFSLMNKIGTVAGKGAFATAFHRGEAIIRTEMGRAYSSADMAMMNQTALDHPGLKKKWLSIIDGRVREEHARAHDQVRPLNQPFSVGGERLMHPHDTSGSAWNTINCRCKAVPWDPAWDKLPPPGVAAELGPLTLADTAGFQSKLNQLDRMGMGSNPRRWADQEYGTLQRRGGLSAEAGWYEMDRRLRGLDPVWSAPWPTPNDPAYWRSKPSFTLDELKLIAGSERTLAGFLVERYGIQLVYGTYDKQADFTTETGTKLLQALETYRARDPSYVVENERLRWLGTDLNMDPNVLGEASVFGDIRFNSLSIDAIKSRTRDPTGERAPRMSNDPALEIYLHEIAHAISYNAGIPFNYAYTAAKALDPRAWQAWELIHNTSAMLTVAQKNLLFVQNELTAANVQLNARRALGQPDSSPESVALLAEIYYLTDKANTLSATTLIPPPGGAFPTEYASGNTHEDFSESLALAQLQPAEFKTNHASRYAWFKQWMPNLVSE